MSFIFLAAACFAQENCGCPIPADTLPKSLSLTVLPDCEAELIIKSPMIYAEDEKQGIFVIISAEDETVLETLQKENFFVEEALAEEIKNYFAAPDFSGIILPKMFRQGDFDDLFGRIYNNRPILPNTGNLPPAAHKTLKFDVSTLAELDCYNFKILAGVAQAQTEEQSAGNNIKRSLRDLVPAGTRQIFIGKTSLKRPKSRKGASISIQVDNGGEITVIMGFSRGDNFERGGRRLSCGASYSFKNMSISAAYYHRLNVSDGSGYYGKGSGLGSSMGGGFRPASEFKININIKLACLE